MTDYTDEDLAKLIAALPPAPPAWTRAAQELPAARAAMEVLVARATADAAQRRAMVADLEGALRDVGVELRPALREELLTRLRADSGER